MIYISEDQLLQVEYLIEQSMHGNHVLFDLETVRRVFDTLPSVPLPTEKAYEVEPHIERLMALPSLVQKRAYLERLEGGELDAVVRTYFNIVENNLFENQEVHH